MRNGFVDTANPVSDHPLNQGLAGWWLPLPNNAGGSRLFDLKGGNHGTLTNGPAWTAGPGGLQALSFDGTNDAVTVAQVASLEPSAAVTCECAFYRSGSQAANDRLVEKEYSNAAAPPYVSYGLEWRGTNTLAAVCSAGGTLRTGTAAAVADLAWTHAVMTYDGANMRLYLNGVEAVAATACSGALAYSGTNGMLDFGGRNTSGEYFSGGIQSVRVYSSARSAGEVGLLYDQWRRGFPDLLRRFNRRSYFSPVQGPSVPGVFNPGWTVSNRVIRGF